MKTGIIAALKMCVRMAGLTKGPLPYLFVLLALLALPFHMSSQVITGLIPNIDNDYTTLVAANPVTNKFYVATGDGLYVIDGATDVATLFTDSSFSGFNVLAVNTITNKIYGFGLQGIGVFDGLTNTFTNIPFAVSGYPSYQSIVVNPITNKVYEVNSNANSLTVLDGQTNVVTSIPVGPYPIGLAVNPLTNRIYVSSQQSNNVTVVDGLFNTAATVSLGTPSGSVVVNCLTNKIYFGGTSGLIVLDGSTNSASTLVPALAPAGFLGSSLAINSLTNKVYSFQDGYPSILVVDAASGLTDHVLATGYPLYGLALDTASNKIYAGNTSGALSVIDANTDIASTINTPLARAVGLNPVTNNIYSLNSQLQRSDCGLVPPSCNTVSVVDGSTPVTSTVNVGASPTAIALNTATNKAYVLNSSSNSVTAIDGVTQSINQVPVGTNPTALATNPITNKTYVVNQGSNSISVVDGATNTAVTVPLGARPGGIAVNPATNKVYVANAGATGNQITIIDGATNAASTLVFNTTGYAASLITVNPATNKIYVAAGDGVTVVDGATNAFTTIPLTISSTNDIAVNPVTNKVYLAINSGLTVMDGATNTYTTVPVSGVGRTQHVQLNSITNKIYVSGVGSGIAVVDGASNAVTYVTTSAAASFLSVNPVTNKIYAATGSMLTVIDGVFNSASTLPLSAAGTGLDLNPVTDQIYVSLGSSNSVAVINDQQPQPNPLTVNITPLSGNQTSSVTPSFTFNAYSTTISPPMGVYYQLDTQQGAWTAATGSNPVFTATLPTLLPGVHTLYAYAVDSQASTLSQPFTPVVGTVQAYTFVVTTAAASVTPPPVTTTSTTTVVTAQTPGALRSNYSGFVGFVFTTGSSALQVTSLGRYAAPGNSGSHVVKLVASNGTDVTGGSVSVTMSGATVGQYQYGTLSSPITLTANTSYYLVSAETAGGDQWYDIGGVTSTGDASVTAPVYSYGTNAYYAVPGLSGKAYVPVNFQYTTTTAVTPPPVTPPPTTTTSSGSFVTAQTPGALRSNYGGFVGFAFTVGSSSLQVSSLGRYAAPGNTGSHLVKLVASNGTDVSGGSVTVSMSGATAGQYQYGTLSSTVTLAANTTYYLVSAETAGADQWYDIGGVTSTSDASVTAPVYSYGPTSYYAVPGLTGKAYVPVNFQYQTTTTTPVTPPATTGTGTALFTSQTPGPLRNNYSGFVGTAIQVGATPLTVSSLGRFFAAGNTGTHTLKLVQSTGVDVAGGSVSVSVTLAGGTAGQYTYAALASAVTLQANTTYYLLSQETSGGDFWYDLGPVTSTGAVQVSGAVYTYGSTSYAVAPGTAGYAYGPVNLLYQ